MKTPVAITIFNRPDTTKKVFEIIRQVRPEKLLIIADGPRPDRPGEAEKCAETRAVFDKVDWNCEVLTNFSETNLGCGKRPYTGFNWVFSLVERSDNSRGRLFTRTKLFQILRRDVKQIS